MNKLIFYFGTNYDRYRSFLFDNKISEDKVTYLSSAYSLLGKSKGNMLIKGFDHINHPDYHHIINIAKAKDMVIVTEKEFENLIANHNVTPGNQPPKE